MDETARAVAWRRWQVLAPTVTNEVPLARAAAAGGVSGCRGGCCHQPQTSTSLLGRELLSATKDRKTNRRKDIDAVKFPAAKRHVINFALGLRVVVEAVPV